jgi:hypothetical protein
MFPVGVIEIPAAKDAGNRIADPLTVLVIKVFPAEEAGNAADSAHV